MEQLRKSSMIQVLMEKLPPSNNNISLDRKANPVPQLAGKSPLKPAVAAPPAIEWVGQLDQPSSVVHDGFDELPFHEEINQKQVKKKKQRSLRA